MLTRIYRFCKYKVKEDGGFFGFGAREMHQPLMRGRMFQGNLAVSDRPYGLRLGVKDRMRGLITGITGKR